MTNTFQISSGAIPNAQREYRVSKIITDFNSEGIIKVETQGTVHTTVNGEVPADIFPNGRYVALETTGQTLLELKNLTAEVVAFVLQKPVLEVTFEDFYTIAMRNGIEQSDTNKMFD